MGVLSTAELCIEQALLWLEYSERWVRGLQAVDNREDALTLRYEATACADMYALWMRDYARLVCQA